jgi:hypothetical protein
MADPQSQSHTLFDIEKQNFEKENKQKWSREMIERRRRKGDATTYVLSYVSA